MWHAVWCRLFLLLGRPPPAAQPAHDAVICPRISPPGFFTVCTCRAQRRVATCREGHNSRAVKSSGGHNQSCAAYWATAPAPATVTSHSTLYESLAAGRGCCPNPAAHTLPQPHRAQAPQPPAPNEGRRRLLTFTYTAPVRISCTRSAMVLPAKGPPMSRAVKTPLNISGSRGRRNRARYQSAAGS